MKAYAKGARNERELLRFLTYRGFACLRQASSGGFNTPVDIVAMKRGLIIAVECKAHQKKPRLEKTKLQRFKTWCERAGALGLLAWRKPGKWLFLRVEDAQAGRYEDENWIELGSLLHALDFR